MIYHVLVSLLLFAGNANFCPPGGTYVHVRVPFKIRVKSKQSLRLKIYPSMPTSPGKEPPLALVSCNEWWESTPSSVRNAPYLYRKDPVC